MTMAVCFPLLFDILIVHGLMVAVSYSVPKSGSPTSSYGGQRTLGSAAPPLYGPNVGRRCSAATGFASDVIGWLEAPIPKVHKPPWI